MSTLNLKSMYNDPSQMREALAWGLFRPAGVPASRHTYARLGINERYLGLFSLIEQVDKGFLRNVSAGKPRAICTRSTVATSAARRCEQRVGADGDDSGRQYQLEGRRRRDVSAQVQRGRPGRQQLRRPGAALPGDRRRRTARWRRPLRHRRVRRRGPRRSSTCARSCAGPGVNMLVGGWDNYFATPANYYLYNWPAGGDHADVIAAPYFRFIPWDYDNTFGIDYFGTAWQYTDLLDWASNTGDYWRRNGHGGRSQLPLITNLLRHTGFRRYYLDHLEHLLDTSFNRPAIDAMISASNLWGRVVPGAYLESDSPHGAPFTGRQYTNDEVYQTGFEQFELRHGQTFVLGVHHYVRMRYDSARKQLDELRRRDPVGSSGASFAAHHLATA